MRVPLVLGTAFRNAMGREWGAVMAGSRRNVALTTKLNLRRLQQSQNVAHLSAGRGREYFMFQAELIRWLRAPRLSEWQALLCGLAAIWIPSMVRMAVAGTVTGCEFTPYLPFVLICAIVLRWWQTGLVALGSVAVLGGLFGGAVGFQLPCFESAAGIFLASSGAMIGIAALLRHAIGASEKRGSDGSEGGIIFSLEKGEVWASWYGSGSPVLLGSQTNVCDMMKDFIEQEQVGRRLARRAGGTRFSSDSAHADSAV
jgi:hypothetical protein